MITGIDYILYTDKSKDAFIEKIKESVTFWEDPYIVIDNEDETPEGIKITRFRKMIRYWVRIEEQNGPDALKHLGNNKVWTPEAKYELVAKVLAGQSNNSVAISAGISDGMLYTWVRKYKELGYNGLVNKKKGRKSKNPDMKKKTIEPKPLTESEREELIRLRAELRQ